MNPLAVKIWMAGCCALHTSTAGELTTIVPKRVFPDPEKWRSRRPPIRGNACWVVELNAGAFVGCAGRVVEVVLCAPDDVLAALPIETLLEAVA